MVKRFWLPAISILVFAFAGLMTFFRPNREGQSRPADGPGGDADQSRAYLSVTATHFKWDDPERFKGQAKITFEWTNVGRTIATKVGFSHAVEFVPISRGVKPAANLGFIWRPQSGETKLEPGDTISCEVGHIPAAIAKKWKAGEYAVILYSAVVYTDFMELENRVETCMRATCLEVDGKIVVELKPAEFNNSSIYGIGPDKF